MRINLNFIYRKKKYDVSNVEHTNLSRVLNLSDLTALGIASTLGSGVYVLIGNIISNYSGPSIILSFFIAGVCSFLAGLCYAELGSRVPRSGSAYIYIYVTVGEFIAFIIGWDVILEYVIGTSTAASALSKYIDSMADFKISQAFRESMPINAPGFAQYPDFLAFGLALIITVLLIVGVKDSSFLNIIFTGANIAIIVFIVICGTTKTNPNNWKLDTYPNMSYIDMKGTNTTCEHSGRCGTGGFAPFGISGILKGTAKCFYAYIGFDVIATTGEEVINPKTTIPLSILFTLIIVSICYVSVSATISLMVPFYVFDPNSPLSEAFRYVGLNWASYVISIGAIISLCTSLYASMFPMPRVVYCMSSDGLLFKIFSYVLPKVKTPIVACLATGLLSALLVLIFDLSELIDMMSIGTLLAYGLVSMCTLILRYRPDVYEPVNVEPGEKRSIASYIFGVSGEPLHKRLFAPSSTKASRVTSYLVNALAIFIVIDILVLCAILQLGDLKYAATYVFFIIFLIVLVVLSFIIWLQPQNDQITTFKVPFVPFFPVASAVVNIYLMTSLNSATWIRFIIWFVIGLIIYFGYGIRNSHENVKGRHQHWLFPCIEKSYATMEENENNESTV